MGKRKQAAQAAVVADLKQADEALRRMAELDRALGDIKARMNEEIDRTKAAHVADAEPLEAERRGLEQALEMFCEANRHLFEDKTRSVDLNFGRVGFRLSTSLRVLARRTWDDVLARLKTMGRMDAVRVREEVNKQAMELWPDTALAAVGVSRTVRDNFYAEPAAEKVPAKAA